MTIVFTKARSHLKCSSLFLAFFNIAKIIIPWFVLPFAGCSWTQANFCIIAYMIHAIMATVYYIRLFNLSKNDTFMMDLADVMHHV